MEPQAAPAQPLPETLQEISVAGLEPGCGVRVAAKFALSPAFIEEGPLTENAKWLVKVVVTAALLEGSAMLVAVTKTVGGDGRIRGAVKSPLALTVPQAAAEQPSPVTVQFTLVLGRPTDATVA